MCIILIIIVLINLSIVWNFGSVLTVNYSINKQNENNSNYSILDIRMLPFTYVILLNGTFISESLGFKNVVKLQLLYYKNYFFSLLSLGSSLRDNVKLKSIAVKVEYYLEHNEGNCIHRKVKRYKKIPFFCVSIALSLKLECIIEYIVLL